jgi:DNA-directed RNA polymerase specialized sigma subunit
MRIEGTVHDQPLSSFEREVRQKLASAPSPLEVLIQREEESQREKEMRQSMKRLRALIKSAQFTPKQKLCYRLIFVEGRSVRECALFMNVSDARICRMIEMIKLALKRTSDEMEARRVLFDRITEIPLTDSEQALCELRFRQGLSLRQIALALGISKPTVYRHVKVILGRIPAED